MTPLDNEEFANIVNLELLDSVRTIVVEAGNIIKQIAEQGFETHYKDAMDPVTTADHAANRYLQAQLMPLVPESGWLSEESRDSSERLSKQFVWIVDPIDGTKEFVERIPQYAVSVALAWEGQVVLGVVYNPALEQCFYGIWGHGAWLNGQRLFAVRSKAVVGSRKTSPDTNDGRLLLLGSRSEMKRGEFASFEADFQVEAVGSIAYKLALVAAGHADATFSLGPKNEWDIAAGVLLVDAAGGRATDRAGQGIVFNRRSTLTNGVLAASESEFDWVLERIIINSSE